VIYKLMSQEMWQSFEASGRFDGAPVDTADGYIHFSAANQVIETASKHFAGVDDLMLVAVDPDRLGEALRWEPSRGGALFPHLYASLPLAAVMSVVTVARGADGSHLFPALAE
jgi:uncharacterized protein (DUF952 family)